MGETVTEGVLLPPPNPASGTEGVSIAVGVAQNQPTVAIAAEKVIGKGWTTGGSWDYAKQTGNRVFGFLTWRPKAKS